jgi:hypothetical protein
MAEKRLLLICRERARVDWLVRVLDPERRGPLWRRAEVSDVASVLEGTHFPLAVYVCGRKDEVDKIGQVLWACSMARRQVPLVVLDHAYDERRALTLFRMGVTDYLSRRDHRGRLAGVVARLLPEKPAAPPDAESAPRPPRITRSKVNPVATL